MDKHMQSQADEYMKLKI